MIIQEETTLVPIIYTPSKKQSHKGALAQRIYYTGIHIGATIVRFRWKIASSIHAPISAIM